MTISTNSTSISYALDGDLSFTALPSTSGGPSSNLSTEVSSAIRADRQVDDLIIVDAEVAGELNYELSYDPYKELLTALLRNSSASSSFSNVSAQTSDNSLNDAGIGNSYEVGDYINVNGMTPSSLNGVYLVTSVLSADSVEVSPAISTDSTVAGTANRDDVYNGTDDPTLFTFLKRVGAYTSGQALSGGSNFFYPGCSVKSASFNFETGSILSGTLGIMGTIEDPLEDAEVPGSDYDGATIADAPAYSIMNSVTSVVNISVSGLTGSACFQNFNLTIDNMTEGSKCIGVLGNKDTADYTIDVTADMTMYFENLDLYKKYKNAESFSVSFALRDADGNALAIYLPFCKFEELDVPIDGKDQFLTLPGSIRALRDPTKDYTVMISFMDK